MAICNNCKATLGCKCQIRKASNGSSCCSNCLVKYEESLKTNQNSQPGINSIKINYPQ